MGDMFCKIGLHRWVRDFEERLYGDARLVADYRYVDRCTRCARRSEYWGRTKPTTTAGD